MKRTSETNPTESSEFYYDSVPKIILWMSIIILIAEAISYALIAIALNLGAPLFEDWSLLGSIGFIMMVILIFLTLLSRAIVNKEKGISIKKSLAGLTINFVSAHLFFAWLYLDIYFNDRTAFSIPLTWVDPLLISAGIATTIGYGGASPVSVLAKIAVIAHEVISFALVVFVIAWIVSLVTDHIKQQAQRSNAS